MHPFSRLVTVFLIFLSFTSFVSAQHTAHGSSNLAIRDESCGQEVLHHLWDLETKIALGAPELAACTTVEAFTAQAAVIVGHVNTCAEAILAVGAKIDVEASLKAEICAKVAAIISLILHACLEVSLKLGLKVVLAILAEIDLCLKLLLVNLGICIEGIVELCAKIIVATCADIMVTLNLKACLALLVGN